MPCINWLTRDCQERNQGLLGYKLSLAIFLWKYTQVPLVTGVTGHTSATLRVA